MYAALVILLALTSYGGATKCFNCVAVSDNLDLNQINEILNQYLPGMSYKACGPKEDEFNNSALVECSSDCVSVNLDVTIKDPDNTQSVFMKVKNCTSMELDVACGVLNGNEKKMERNGKSVSVKMEASCRKCSEDACNSASTMTLNFVLLLVLAKFIV